MRQLSLAQTAARVAPVGPRVWGAGLAERSKWSPRRKMLVMFGAGVLSQYSLDVLAVGHKAGVLAIRFIWALGMVASALLLDERSELAVRLHTAFQSVLASLCFSVLVLATGATGSVYFSFFPC